MNNKILADAGENFEYIRTIVENKIELAKIDGSERVSRILSSILLFTVLSVFSILLFISLLIGLAIWLTEATGSIAIGMLSTSGIILFTGILFFLLRKVLIFKPVTHFIFHNFLDID